MNKRTKQSRRPSSAPADTQHAEATHSAPPSLSLQDVLAGLKQLPQDWHACGCLLPDVLDAIARHTAGKDIRCSAETGTGKSTVLLSHISKQHLTFALNSGESITTVKSSPLFHEKAVTFIEGPSQKTLPAYQFQSKLQLVMLDGPHGFPFPNLEYYYLYPHLEPGGLLIIDDINVPTIYQLFDFVRTDDMFEIVEIVGNTAFLRRTNSPTFDPYGDGWWLQQYNRRDGKLFTELLKVRELVGNATNMSLHILQEAEIASLQTKLTRINNSLSFRLGMLMTAPARKLLDLIEQRTKIRHREEA